MRALIALIALAMLQQPGVPAAVDTWTPVTPTYIGQPDPAGYLSPASYNVIAAYDAISKRTLHVDKWTDAAHGAYIYANAVLAYDPATNTVEMIKISNWKDGSTELPANATEPTPIDRHPLGGVVLDPVNRLLFLINGANQIRHDLYPDHPNDTWKLSLALRKWTKVADKVAGDPHPPTDVGSFAGSAYDPLAKRILYFAVDNAGTSHTWQLDPLVGRWSLRSDAPNAADIHVASAGFAVDTKRNRVLAYGGQYNTSCCLTTSLRAYDFATNRWSLLADAPIPAHGAEFAYDSLHDVFLALVGTTTLIYMPTTNTWKTMPGTINRGANLARQNIAYNVAQDVFVFQGGTMVQAIWAVFRYGGTVITPPPMPPGTPANLAIIR